MSSFAPLNLDEEVRLFTTNAEREKYGLLATLYGIIVSLDYLERAYVRDSVTAAEYATISSTVRINPLSYTLEEVLPSMYETVIAIQDDAQACRGRGAFCRGVHGSISSQYILSILWKF